MGEYMITRKSQCARRTVRAAETGRNDADLSEAGLWGFPLALLLFIRTRGVSGRVGATEQTEQGNTNDAHVLGSVEDVCGVRRRCWH